MSAYFLTGAGTDIGKTYVSCALLTSWRGQGLAARAIKPVMSGFDPAHFADSDAGRLLHAMGAPLSAEAVARITPWRLRAPIAPPLAAEAEGVDLDLDAIVDFCRAEIRVGGGPLLIEGAGGVMSPLTPRCTNIDLMRSLGIPTIFVVGSYLGAVSHTLTALECMASRRAPMPLVVISQSADCAGLHETYAMIRDYGPAGLRVVAVGRNASGAALSAALGAPNTY